MHNPAWVTPYLGCILVALGMLYQFLYHLVNFIRKSGEKPRDAAPPRSAKPRRRRLRLPVLTKSSRP